MILIDALYVNVGGGKVLLDYLIRELNKTTAEVFYLLDERIKGDHEPIKDNKVRYLRAGILKRRVFYKDNSKKFSTILCFGNLPPTQKTAAHVFTYFHQPLFLGADKDLPLQQRLKLGLKMFLLSKLVANSDQWLVQSELIRNGLAKKYRINKNSIQVVPFYPAIPASKKAPVRRPEFLYVSNGYHHKNHDRLLDAFTGFYDQYKTSVLHVTVEKNYEHICRRIDELKNMGYPIINHGFLPQNELSALYEEAAFFIFPSLAESFGLGIIEAIEKGCKIIGANRPYMHAVCIPSVTFDPESVEEMTKAMAEAISGDTKESQQLVFDNVNELIDLLIKEKNG